MEPEWHPKTNGLSSGVAKTEIRLALSVMSMTQKSFFMLREQYDNSHPISNNFLLRGIGSIMSWVK